MSGAYTVAYLAFGANLADRAASIAAALARLPGAGVAVQACSPLYETDAVASEPQPRYLNATARVETSLAPRALLAACLAIEAGLGRTRPPGRPHAPRTIDIDLLLMDDQVIHQPPDLIVPHPRLLERPFVRIPLADVALPGLIHPITGEPLDRAAPDPSVRPAGAAPPPQTPRRRLKSSMVAASPCSSGMTGSHPPRSC